MKKAAGIFLCVYIISGILNVRAFDFCGDHIDPLALAFSFGTYILFFIITEIEVFRIKNSIHLLFCLLFWAVHLGTIAVAFFSPDLFLVLFVFVISPSIGIITFLKGWQDFIFLAVCLIAAIQILVVLLKDQPTEQSA